MLTAVLLLIASVSLSTGRGVFSKEVSINTFNAKSFFFYQGCLFFCALLSIFFFDVKCFTNISNETLIYGLIYGCLLIGSQWLYTIALKKGNASICAMVYAFGFIIPTLCGFIFWNEQPTVLKIIGISLVIPLIILVLQKKTEKEHKSNLYIIPLIFATICSGGLGVLQKIQQRSDFANQKIGFLVISFIVATLSSFIVFLSIKKKANQNIILKKSFFFADGAGLCFGLANMVNTTLASLVAANILFPTQNIGVIFLTAIVGFVLFKEKPRINQIIAFILGITSIILLTL